MTEKPPEFTPVTGDRVPRTGLGLPQDAANALCYALMWLSGFVLFVAERKDPLVRFHAAVSVIVFVPLHLFLIAFHIVVLMAAPTAIWVKFIVWAVYGVLMVAIVGAWVWLILAGYRCWKPEIPGVSKLADRLVEMTTPEEKIR